MNNDITKRGSLIERLLFPRTQGLRISYHILFWVLFILLHYSYALPTILKKNADPTVSIASFGYFMKVIPEYYLCVGFFYLLRDYLKGFFLFLTLFIFALAINHVFSFALYSAVDHFFGLENMTERYRMYASMYLVPFNFRDPAAWLVFGNDISDVQFFILPASLKTAKYAANERFMRQKIQDDARTMELKALKSQINPHFVFNVLNAAYAKVLPVSEDAAEYLQKVSEILRLSLYKMDDEFTRLETELEYMSLYVELESIRSSHRCQINVEQHGQIKETHRVPTVSLITLVENAFKHGVHSTRHDSFVDIQVTVQGDTLTFDITNSKPSQPLRSKSGSGGIGLVNLERRLAIYFPGRYKFGKFETETEFKVSVQIPVQ
ncbi:sensor histidine kinase [Dyadobacter jiangsuensis]|uniref:Histidine kinase n=1 Tax=Dyadobacter jiangsuensis TaxID=1591085 RepID=A0A2P8FLB8_9BACT|nr:histidine kinase [Dyadobacter jiangsuensis]PSL22496.1 histidine kinase [Dyadobacter jiangsuensis]